MLSVATGSFQFTWAENSPRSAYTKLSVAAGSVQFTAAENRPLSAYTVNGLDGQVAPNVGG